MTAFAFRPLTRDDFGVPAGWPADPLVARWWCHDHDGALHYILRLDRQSPG